MSTTIEKPGRRSFFGGKRTQQQPGHAELQATQPQRRGFSSGFSFGIWLRLHGVDLITMAAMGAVGLGVYEANPAPTRSFPVYNLDGNIAYPEFAYPLRKNIIPIYAAALLAALVPIFFFILFQIRIRNIESLLGTTMGLLEGLITGAVFQVFHKWLIGGLRPHFLDVCKPNISSITQSGNGFRQIMYDRSICTGDEKEINDSLESWMSGHSTAAFAGFVYLFLYFNAQLKVMSNHRPAYWKMILTIAPLLGASLISASLTIDEYHNWGVSSRSYAQSKPHLIVEHRDLCQGRGQLYDCVGGALTGTLCAFIAFRKTFAATWDFRFNHILLPRTTSLFHRHPVDSGVQNTRFDYSSGEGQMYYPAAGEGGWKRQDWAMGGAPNDAARAV